MPQDGHSHWLIYSLYVYTKPLYVYGSIKY